MLKVVHCINTMLCINIECSDKILSIKPNKLESYCG